MKHKILTTILILQVFFNASSVKSRAFENISETERNLVEFDIKIQKDFKIIASVKSLKTKFSQQLKTFEELPNFYAKFKDRIVKADSSIITITSVPPVSSEQFWKLNMQVKNAGIGSFNLLPEPPDKPNPLLLIVKWDNKGKVTVNRTDVGMINDLSDFKKLLDKVFADRERFNVFKEGTKEIEKTAYLQIPANTSENDSNYEKLLQTLQNTGATPIGIITDEKIQAILVENEKNLNKITFDKLVFRFTDASVKPESQRNYKIVLTKTSAEIVLESYKILDRKTIKIDEEQFNKIAKIIQKAQLKTRPNLDDNGCSGGTTDIFEFVSSKNSVFKGFVYHCGGEDFGDLVGDSDAVKNELTSLFPKIKAKFRNIK